MDLPRLYPILDVALLESRRFPLLDAARILLESGIHLLQWRCKVPPLRRHVDELDQLSLLCRKHAATLIVNDRADLARMADAGLHLGQDDLSPAAARGLLGPEPVIGLSTHNESQFLRALSEPVDYLALGPVFPTATKENPDPVVGLDVLAALASRSERPVVAIGGITRGTAGDVIAAGAASVAVIGDLIPTPCTADALRRRADEWDRLLRYC